MAKKKIKGDVCWFSIKWKKPIAYSTIADSDAIALINQPNYTANDLMTILKSGKYIVSQDMINIIQIFIDKKCGEEIIRTNPL